MSDNTKRDPREARILSIGVIVIGAIALLLGETSAGLAGVIIGLGMIAAERYYLRRDDDKRSQK